jgi:hypothetical protein
MNSIFNEQPTRQITPEFVEKAVNEASSGYGVQFINNENIKLSRALTIFNSARR